MQRYFKMPISKITLIALCFCWSLASTAKAVNQMPAEYIEKDSPYFTELMILFVGFVILTILVSYLKILNTSLNNRRKELSDTNAALNREIQERKKIEQDLRVNEEKLHNLFLKMRNGFALHEIICNENGLPVDYRFLEVNPAFEEMTGLLADNIIGKTVLEVLPDTEPIWIQRYGQVALTGQAMSFEHYAKSLDKYFAVTAYASEPGRFVVIVEDINERKQAEIQREKLIAELQRKNEDMDNVLFIASHDLRSPLVNMLGFVGELERSIKELIDELSQAEIAGTMRDNLHLILKEDIPESLNFIKKGGSTMGALLSGLLRLGRVGTASINSIVIDVNELLDNILIDTQFKIRGNDVIVKVQDGLPECQGDLTLINQVFVNLIDNSIKYRHPARACKISIEGQVQQEHSIYYVKDNGIGIAPEEKDKIFNLFYQSNAALSGDGVGLTIVRQILERQAGSIDLESTVGQGTVFIIKIPGPNSKESV